MKEPKISVVMAVYNGEKHISTSIESILNQTFKDFEFIIVNDCSSDRTLDIIKSYNDKRIRIINNEKNLGQTKSLNIGVRLSKGGYIGRIDADDFSYPRRFEKQLEFLKKNSELAVVGTSGHILNKNGKIERRRFVTTEHDKIFFRMFFENPIIHVSVLINKEKLLMVGGYNDSLSIAQDYDLWSRFLINGERLGNLRDVLVAYRIHQNTVHATHRHQAMIEFNEVFYRNIHAFTNLKIDRQAVSRLCKIYSIPVPGDLDYKDCEDVLKLFLDFFSNLKPEFNFYIDWRLLRSVLGKFQHNIGMSMLRRGDLVEARNMLLRSIRNGCFSPLPYTGFFLTFLNASIREKILGLREKYINYINKKRIC